MTSPGISDFLLARIAEDEAAARALLANYGSVTGWLERNHDSAAEQVAALDLAPWLSRLDPARVLAECDAKRRIVVRCQEMLTAAVPMAVHLAQQTLADLGRPLADHCDYREEWKP